MKILFVVTIVLTLAGCTTINLNSTQQIQPNHHEAAKKEAPDAKPQCIGTTDLPPNLANEFNVVEDSALLEEALGKPLKGRLCQGRVYESSSNQVTIFRAWNSTNPGSQFGEWWAFSIPAGNVAQYREDYEICYQWSPLDKMTKCTLTKGAKIVVGTGQSAECSQYLTYPVSAAQQVFLVDASTFVSNCETFDDQFKWVPISTLQN